MSSNLLKYFCFFTVFCLTLFSCQDDLSIAEKSLIGQWTIYKVYSNDNIQEGDFGTFNFKKDGTISVALTSSFLNLNSLESWDLNHQRVNSGFVKVDEFTLNISSLGTFNCAFEDQTNDAHKNAKNIALLHLNDQYELFLTKE